MPLADRDYMRGRPERGGWGGGGFHLGLPRPPRAVIGLMIASGAAALLVMATGGAGSPLYDWLALCPAKGYQLWRFLTFQFMHASLGHLAMNLLGLYFLGSPLERAWGRRTFLAFYLCTGAFSGLCYMAIAGILTATRPASSAWSGSLVGASGGVLACLMACALLFPHMLVLFLPIRIVTAILALLYVLMLAHKGKLGDAAHLGGMIAAAGWIWLVPRLPLRLKLGVSGSGRGRWQRKLSRQRRRQAEVDRILDKIRARGIDSLNWRDKRKLRRASRRRQEEL